MAEQTPFNIRLLDVNDFIKRNNCMEVTSTFVHTPSSNQFHEQGLFSEQIFGNIATPNRMVTFGYMTLNCRVFAPHVFQIIQSLKRFYIEIMCGKSFAVWNEEARDFDRASESEAGADTGYTFFLSHFFDIAFQKNASLKRNDKVDILNKYPDQLLIDKYLVIPAGLRDVKADEGRQEKDSINNLYVSLLNNCKAMPPTGANKPIYDTIHYAIQRKVNEIHLYIADMMKGKKGFLEGKYGARNIAQGTRNVITATTMEAASPDSPQYHKVDETKIPLFQCAKGFSSLVIYNMKHNFYSPVLDISSDQVPLINPDTLKLEYVPIDESEKDKLLGTEGMMKFIDLFQDGTFRFKPVTVMSEKKRYWMYLVYDTGAEIYIIRDVDALKSRMSEHGLEYDPKYLRALTNCELLYITTLQACHDKYGTVTRYPVADEQSIYISKVHLMSTSPGRIVHMKADVNGDVRYDTLLPEYPIINGSFTDAMLLHPTRLKALGADFDGNCLTGDTLCQIKYTNEWLAVLQSANYNDSVSQSANSVVTYIRNNTYLKDDSFLYAEIEMQQFPRPGLYKKDKHGARVFDIPTGCYVLSYRNGAPSYEPITMITIEDNCNVIDLSSCGRRFSVSTNPSTAIFDHTTGDLVKVSPNDAIGKMSPVFIKDIEPLGTLFTFDEGWLIGAIVSDGYLTEKYFGFTKLDSAIRNNVIRILEDKVGHKFKINEYVEEKSPTKLSRSIKFQTSDKDVMKYVSSLNLYTKNASRSAITKQISTSCIKNGSNDFLIGILCGLIDGDGSCSFTRTGRVDIRFSTSSPSLVRSIQLLLYKLGIQSSMTTSAPRNWSKECYTIVMNSKDVAVHKFYMTVYGEYNNLVFSNWKHDLFTMKDYIPLSEYDRCELFSIAFVNNDTVDMCYFSDKRINCTQRERLLKYVQVVNKSLRDRIENKYVRWGKVKNLGCERTETVYDFIVPTTKVFAVNNGAIVYDTCSWIPILSEEATKECEQYVHSLSNYILPNGRMPLALDDLCGLTLHSLTMDTPELRG